MVAVPLHQVQALARLVSHVLPQGARAPGDTDPSLVQVERRLMSPLREAARGIGSTKLPAGRCTWQLRMEKGPGGGSLASRNREGVVGPPMMSAAA